MNTRYILLVAAAMLGLVQTCRADGEAGLPAPASRSQPVSAPASQSQPASRIAPAASAPAVRVDPNAPVVRVDGNAIVALHDLGKVRAGSEYFVVFAVENAKEANVSIRQVRPDCECISAIQPPAFLAARGATRITARFVPPKVNDVYGSELVVITDDPQRKIIRLRVLCKVAP